MYQAKDAPPESGFRREPEISFHTISLPSFKKTNYATDIQFSKSIW
jgi:hypothetical protein